jgi:hypothetical protein
LNAKKDGEKKAKSPTLKDKLREKHDKQRKDRVRTIPREEHLAGHQVGTDTANGNGRSIYYVISKSAIFDPLGFL